MRDESRGKRGAGFADEGFVGGNIAGVRAGIQLALGRAAFRNARKAENRKRHQHGFDRRMNQREEERHEHQRQQKRREGERTRGARIEPFKQGVELLQRAGEKIGEFRRGAVEDEREEKRGGIGEKTHGKDLPFLVHRKLQPIGRVCESLSFCKLWRKCERPQAAFLEDNRRRGEIAAGRTKGRI